MLVVPGSGHAAGVPGRCAGGAIDRDLPSSALPSLHPDSNRIALSIFFQPLPPEARPSLPTLLIIQLLAESCPGKLRLIARLIAGETGE